MSHLGCSAGCRVGTFLLALAAALPCVAWSAQTSGDAALARVAIVYVTKDDAEPVRSSLLDPVIADYGWQGARFGVDEINVNGRFAGKQYELIKVTAAPGGDVRAAARDALAHGHLLIVADLGPADLLSIADLPEAKGALILDARSSDDSLRQRDCRDNVFHLLPDWAMRADALGQFLARRNWKRWLLLKGAAPEDQAFSAALKRAASRVGAKIVAERSYQYQSDIARAAGGQDQIQSQIRKVTHVSSAYDVLIVADTGDSFGDHVPFNTWDPRPIAGTHGLEAVAWNSLFREYAARGMQYRFHLTASRDMTERDYGNWLAVSIIGEAATRSGATDAAGIKSYLLSDQFSVPAFKGEGLTFRRWNHQLRQPILLFGPRVLVSMWPQDGTGHSKLLTDTLGYEQSESECHLGH